MFVAKAFLVEEGSLEEVNENIDIEPWPPGFLLSHLLCLVGLPLRTMADEKLFERWQG